jgi:hypothetical protein
MRSTISGALIRTVLAGACLAALPVTSYATEQGEQRRDARDTRQDARQDSRDAKVDCRRADQKNNAQCRQDKRNTKQDARKDARDIKY